MTPEVWFLLLGGLVLLLLAWTVWTLVRLSRLEARVARAWTALDTQLQRRAELAAGGARVAAGYDWDVLARQILAVYETVLTPDGGAVTAGEDDDETFPAVPVARLQARSALRRRTQH